MPKKRSNSEFNIHTRKRPASGSLFPYHPKSLQNPIKSSKNLPISRKNRFATEIYAGNISCHYRNYVTYDIIIFQICHIRHNDFLIMSHTTFSNLYYVIYDIIDFLRYVTYDIILTNLSLLAELWTHIITKHLFYIERFQILTYMNILFS